MAKHTCIWLQIKEEPVTWCQDKIHDEDIQYIIVSKYEALEQKLEKCETRRTNLRESADIRGIALEKAEHE